MKLKIEEIIKSYKEDNTNVCSFCSKTFSCRISLLRHQKTVKSCLEKQGKEETDIECENCKKFLSIKYYKQHKIKCDIIFEKTKKNEEEYTNKNKDINDQNKLLLEEVKTLKSLNEKLNEQVRIELKEKDKLKEEINEYKTSISDYKMIIFYLKEKLSSSKEEIEDLKSEYKSVIMKLVDKNI